MDPDDQKPVQIKRALISVTDKSGVVELARFLAEREVEIVSTGGTAGVLADAGIPVVQISDYTGFPEIMDGRVKTLHPIVHGGLLSRRDMDDHVEAMTLHGIGAIDLLVVNLYPFIETVARNADFDASVENIDIGGPAMIRSAAKNHDFVAVVVDPADYADIIDVMTMFDGATPVDLRRRLAAKAFSLIAGYDGAIAEWLNRELDQPFPQWLSIGARLRQVLRYGENPHQQAAFYTTARTRVGIATATQIQGKELSYNNLNDTDAAYELVAEFNPDTAAAIVIVKHANPSGVASGDSLSAAYERALACDPVSAFGGIVASNRPLDAATAEAIIQVFTEVVIAPDAEPQAREILAAKPNIRVLLTGGLPDPVRQGMVLKAVAGGILVQTRDSGRLNLGELLPVTRREPNQDELMDLLFAFRVCKHVKSNAIVYARAAMTVGIGAGQMSRVDSVHIAARKGAEAARAAGDPETWTKGSVVASDAFFPFADGLMAAAEAGATAVIQPGGSIRDDEIIAAADEAGLAMIFTGIRHFRH